MTIGFIGLGIMGGPMVSNIIRKRPSDKVIVYNRSPERTAEIVSLGAEAAETVEEIGTRADIVITMVTTGEVVCEIFDTLIPNARQGQIFIDMSSIEPATSVKLAEQVAARGASMLDAPVVKSQPAAVDGTLGIYVGGPAETLGKVHDILACMGNNIIHLGENGAGLVMKMCHNTLVAEIQNGVNETLVMARRFGISVDDFAAAISYGGGQNFYLDMKAAAIRDENYQTAFSVKNMHKDLGITARLIEKSGLHVPAVEIARDVYAKAMEANLGEMDFSATYKIVSKNQE